MWFMGLDMASGFWAVRMAKSVKLISDFVCPFGKIFWIVTHSVSESRDLCLKTGDLVSLTVLERFHVADVGSQLVDLQIEMIPVSDEAIPREVALARFALQRGQPSISI
ncbi:hypothetical protein PHMEG_00033464 [Phytophthora megakarya]|uniref:Reverse transcriptase n=1 Tax=Phytophthora megakarya TaxID=4795 RepID=A0A225UT98_9STRA|nr:hypothetical protein PHMEG_00033464 [Phytophthora megakarya]